MAVAKPIIVVTRTRSGSNLLGGYLAQLPGTVSLGEVFKPDAPRPISGALQKLDLAPSELARLARLQADDRVGFWRAVRDVLGQRGLVPAAKMFYGGAAPDDALWSAFADALILHLVRENVLATVVSRKLAQRARNWRETSDGDYDSQPVAVGADECEDHLQKLGRHVLWTRARFAGCDYREISYDRICDPAAASEALAAASGARVALTPRTGRQRNRPLAEMVANYREVSHYDRNFPLIDETFSI